MRDVIGMLSIPAFFAVLAYICEIVAGPGSAIAVLVVGVIVWLLATK